MKKKESERRRARRYSKCVSVEYVIRPARYPRAVRLTGRTEDLSLSGLCVVSGIKFSEWGSLLRLEIILPALKGELKIKTTAQVRWEKPLKRSVPGVLQTGLRFVKMSDRERALLREFLSVQTSKH